jgi:small GTP-binding protein
MQIWDTAGEERYRSFTRLYTQGAEAALIVFDVSELSTFESIPSWIQMVNDSTKRPVIFIVANKVDLPKRAIPREMIADFADREKLTFVEVSAKLGPSVATLFQNVAETVAKLESTTAGTLLKTNPGCCGG